jgi:cytochrome c oxidase assembly protein subunit 15
MTFTQSQSTAHSSQRAISIWLVCCLAVIFIMVTLGGLTRLTQSGLSMVEWKPITGVLPPLNAVQWEAEFADYKNFPQFQKTYPDMTLEEFQHIFWLEYLHRLVGRLAGMVFLLPLVYFTCTRALGRKQSLKLAVIFTLGGAQGLIGWYMVKSGLIDNPHVSPYRLALHLGTGFTLYGLVLWQLLSFSHPEATSGGFELPAPPRHLKLFSCGVTLLIFLQILLGAFVAGLHAGMTYNTFPLMDGHWIPPGLFPLDPWYRSMFEDVTTVQFEHRMMAYTISLVIPLFWLVGRNNPHISHLLPILFSMFVVQILLGILTLLFVVPVPLASLHQINALVLFGIAVSIMHRLFLPLKTVVYEMGSKSAMA